MKKYLFTSFLCLFCIFSNGQSTQGLNYIHDYNRDLQNQIILNNYETELQNERYEKIKEAYKKSLEINKYSSTPKENPSTGWYKVLMTDGKSQVGNRQVYVEGGIVTIYTNAAGAKFTKILGGKVIDFRTVVGIDENTFLELFFNISVNE